jgi:hypothetical protein
VRKRCQGSGFGVIQKTIRTFLNPDTLNPIPLARFPYFFTALRVDIFECQCLRINLPVITVPGLAFLILGMANPTAPGPDGVDQGILLAVHKSLHEVVGLA